MRVRLGAAALPGAVTALLSAAASLVLAAPALAADAPGGRLNTPTRTSGGVGGRHAASSPARVTPRLRHAGCVLACRPRTLASRTRKGAETAPYGLHDAGGFRNVLPAGENGTDNVAQLAAFLTTGAVPPHWNDQEPLYDGLLYASARPGFGSAGVDRYFKDATFGVRPGDVASTETPHPGVTIVRDASYGVPHIYGATSEDVAWGAGYAGAEDRLFLMDVLRHTGEAELSSFVGGSPGNRAMDHAQWQSAPYTTAELQQQFDDAGKFYGARGRELQRLVTAYVDGINAYVAQATANPTKLPAEYVALGKVPQPWTPADVIAAASLIGGIFGRGGGSELASAELARAFVKRYGKRRGRAAWSDFREANDPEAPTTVVGKRFPYETGSPFSPRGLAMPDPGSVTPAPVAPPVPQRAVAAERRAGTAGSGRYDFGDIGAELMQALDGPPHASNWELVSARASATGHPLGVLGPQVGYYVPQILMEEDLHGPGFDARGATFPGINLFILLGHGRDYAWSATTATSDNVDTFAEVLCQDAYHYRYKGRCLPMQKLVRTNSWTPNAVDQTPPGSETLTAYRTVHGIVFARGTVHRRKVAFVSARSTYFHEADSALFFQDLNDPRFMRRGYRSFDKAAKVMNFAFNWVYIDSRHTDYQLTGWYPQRARDTSPDFPILGTGRYDWKGYDPKTDEADWLPQAKHPHALDQRYIVSWNNKQAPGWAAADDQYGYGPIYRQQLIANRIRRDLRGGRKVTLPKLVQSMEEPATEDIRAVELLPILERAIGKPRSPKLRGALRTLAGWRRSGSHRRDLDQNGAYEHQRAVELMDAWWPKLLAAEFRPALGGPLYRQLQGLSVQGIVGFSDPVAPDFAQGWYGYVSKDLRDIFGPRPRAPYSRDYCGGGSRSRCRKALRRSLAAALKVTPQQLYGHGDCESDPTPRCWDLNRPTVTSAVSVPETMPFQNRPTFQQAVSVTRRAR